jgi:hypothetical protein
MLFINKSFYYQFQELLNTKPKFNLIEILLNNIFNLQCENFR